MSNQKLDTTKFELEIEEQRNQLRADRLDLSFGEIISMYERNEIVIKPAFQRYFRWDEEQRTRFIESILLGIPIPPIFVAEDKGNIWELVDGLQRISTILSFFGILRSEDEGIKSKNNWVLCEGDRVPLLEGFTYETLPNKWRLHIKRATCRVEILRSDSNYDMRYELFNRLNTGGSLLTQQEIRNCIFRDIPSNFYDFLKKISNNPDFLSLVDLPIDLMEKLFNEELALRFLSLYKNLSNVHSTISLHMTQFMQKAVENKSFEYEKYEKLFSDVFKLLKPLGSKIFRQPDGNFATSLYDVITIGIAENYDNFKNKKTEDILKLINEQVRKDDVLMKFSRKGGSNQRIRIINRLKEAKRIFGQEL